MCRAALGFLVVVLFPLAAVAQTPPAEVTKFIASLRQPEPPLTIAVAHELLTAGSCDLFAFSHDSTHVATAVDSNTLAVWTTADGVRRSPATLATTERVSALALSRTGQYLLAGHPQQPPTVFDVKTGNVVAKYTKIASAIRAACITSDDKHALLVDDQGMLHRYELLRDEGSATKLPIAPLSAAIAPGGRAVILARPQGSALGQFDGTAWRFTPLRVSGTACAAGNDAIAIIDGARGDLHVAPLTSAPALVSRQLPFIWNYPNVFLSHDARRAVLNTSAGYLEILELHTIVTRRRANLHATLRAFALSPDGQLLVWSDGQQRTRLARLPAGPLSRQAELAEQLRIWHATKDYARLEALATELDRDFAPLAWSPNRTPGEAVSSLMIYDVRGLDAWIAARPEAARPRIWRAKLAVHDAWQSRGSGVAATVTEAGWQGFRDHIAKAKEIIGPVVQSPAPPPDALEVWFTIAMAEGAGSAELEPYIQKLFQHSPTALEPHYQLCTKAMVRWGGDQNDLARYAARAADHVGGPAGDALYARMAIEQIPYYQPEDFLRESWLDRSRILRGFRHLVTTADDRQAMAVFGLWFCRAAQAPEDEKWLAEQLKGADVSLIWPERLRDRRNLNYFQSLAGAVTPPATAAATSETSTRQLPPDMDPGAKSNTGWLQVAALTVVGLCCVGAVVAMVLQQLRRG